MNDIKKYFRSKEMEELVEEYGEPMILNDSGQVTGVNQIWETARLNQSS